MTTSQIIAFTRRAIRIARTEIAAVTALFVAAFGVVAFVELADDMTDADGQTLDHAVLAAMRPHTDPSDALGPWWLEEAAADLTSLGGIAVLSLFATVVVVFLIMQRKRLSALLLLIGLSGGVVLSEGLKAVFERDRPPQIYQAVDTLNASFPSGHALLSAVFYLSIAVMLTRAFPERHFKVFILVVGILLTLIVGATRVYLGAHWASDVLAGWSVGAAWAMVLWLIAYSLQRLQAARMGKTPVLPTDQPAP